MHDDVLASHGGDIYALARSMKRRPEDFIDFSSNTHAFALDITQSLIAATPHPFAHYPDTQCAALRETLAAHEEVSQESILVGNGAAELIWLAVLALNPRRVLLVGPMFSEYARVCEAFGVPYDIVTPPAEQEFVCGARELHTMWGSQADLAVLCTPNNPSGATYPNIRDMLDVLRTPRVLIDNAYREFLWGDPAYADNRWVQYQQWIRPGVTVFSMNSATKFFACPGIRLGYLVGDAGHLRRMGRIRPPWSVSPFAQVLGVRFFENIEAYRDRLPHLQLARIDLAMRLRRMHMFDPDLVFEGPSFVTSGLRDGLGAHIVRQRLLQQGIIVRDCDSIPGMPKGFIRMQARCADDNDALAQALEWHTARGWSGTAGLA